MSGMTKEWYLKLNGERRGPFPAWQVSRYMLLQRIDTQTPVSRDGEKWEHLGKVPELHPERRLAIIDLPEEEKQRLEATEKWVEEHPNLFKPAHRHVGEGGSYEEQAYTHVEVRPHKSPNRLLAYSVVLLVLLAVVAIPYLIPPSEKPSEPQCDAPVAPRVNWSNCLLSSSSLEGADLTEAVLRNVNLSVSILRRAKLIKADLAYANLSLSNLSGAQLQNAQLKGANLRNSNLRNANLEGADLSYADLSGAKLKGANFTNVRLGYAIWEENVTCMPQSVGKCIPARVAQ
jgi:hypothetical protein